MDIDMSMSKKFEDLGGKGMLEVITKIFYDKIYDHPWLSQFFKNIKQEIIESQQVDFMQGHLGGKKVYCGQLPVSAHKHMFVTKELFDLRQAILRDSMKEANASRELVEAWLKIDDSFRAGIIKASASQCEKRFFTDEILAFKNPDGVK